MASENPPPRADAHIYYVEENGAFRVAPPVFAKRKGEQAIFNNTTGQDVVIEFLQNVTDRKHRTCRAGGKVAFDVLGKPGAHAYSVKVVVGDPRNGGMRLRALGNSGPTMIIEY